MSPIIELIKQKIGAIHLLPGISRNRNEIAALKKANKKAGRYKGALVFAAILLIA